MVLWRLRGRKINVFFDDGSRFWWWKRMTPNFGPNRDKITHLEVPAISSYEIFSVLNVLNHSDIIRQQTQDISYNGMNAAQISILYPILGSIFRERGTAYRYGSRSWGYEFRKRLYCSGFWKNLKDFIETRNFDSGK